MLPRLMALTIQLICVERSAVVNWQFLPLHMALGVLAQNRLNVLSDVNIW